MGDLGTNVFTTLDELRDALVDRIEDAGLEKPCIVAVMPGQEVSLDYCSACTNGMAWTRLVSISRLENQAASGVEALGTCASGFTAVIEMGWMRGGPVVKFDEGTGSVVEVPNENELRDAAILQMSDMTLMLQSLCRSKVSTGWRPKAIEYSPFGPQGGCYGGLWTITMPVE